MIQANTIMALRKRGRPQLDRVTPIARNAVKTIVEALQLYEVEDNTRRAELFIGYCRLLNYTNATAQLYFELARKAFLFGNTDLRPDHKAFGGCGKPHTRTCTRDEFMTLYRYLSEHMSTTTAPLMLPVLTGLRSFEVVQLNTDHLKQLLDGHVEVDLLRKNTNVHDVDRILWHPTYTSQLRDFIVLLTELYADLIATSEQLQRPLLLFPIRRQALNMRFRTYFYRATGTMPPHGFGVHSCRNMMASEMAAGSDNIAAIQRYLQHARFSTTQQYLRADYSHTTKQFDRLTRHKFATLEELMEAGVPQQLNAAQAAEQWRQFGKP